MEAISPPGSEKPEPSSPYFWKSDDQNGVGENDLLLIVGDPEGIVVARIATSRVLAWTLTLDIHRDPHTQTHISTGSISEAMEIAERWATEDLARLMRGY